MSFTVEGKKIVTKKYTVNIDELLVREYFGATYKTYHCPECSGVNYEFPENISIGERLLCRDCDKKYTIISIKTSFDSRLCVVELINRETFEGAFGEK